MNLSFGQARNESPDAGGQEEENVQGNDHRGVNERTGHVKKAVLGAREPELRLQDPLIIA